MSLQLIASLFSATMEVAPQSISALKSRPTRWKQVLNRPPEPKASPQPTNCKCMNTPGLAKSPLDYDSLESRALPNPSVISITNCRIHGAFILWQP